MRLGPYSLGPNDTPENGIYTGDARELAKAIPDESVDLIFTDPVYDRIDDYAWLSRLGARILNEDRACLAWVSKVRLGHCQLAMEMALDYQTTLFYTVMAKSVIPAFQIGIVSWTTPCLVFAKGRYKCKPFLVDTWITANGPQSRFRWQKNTPVSVKWIEAFNRIRGPVLDCFCGSGAFLSACVLLGIPYLAFEIDPDVAEMARERVRNTQPPLFVPEPEQAAMELA